MLQRSYQKLLPKCTSNQFMGLVTTARSISPRAHQLPTFLSCPRCISTTYPIFVKIYTKTGDKGNSSLFTGERRPKDDLVFEALGATDELSSHLALAREFAIDEDHPYADRILRIQCILQDIGAVVATPKSTARESQLKKVGISQRHACELEEWIDEYDKQLPPLENFILPGGGKASSSLHIARTVCRRAERKVCPLVKGGEADEQVLVYLNRLSDFLFTAARLAAKLEQRKETIYIRAVLEEASPPKSVDKNANSKSKTASDRS